MRDLGDFLIIDSIVDETGMSVYFLQIQEFLSKYTDARKLDKSLIITWNISGSHPTLKYGVVSNAVVCLGKEEGFYIPTHTWPDFQFKLNLENILQ